jgi:His/Glu/Gln/Arg/opine family amino acid ABC transporter permease subunit
MISGQLLKEDTLAILKAVPSTLLMAILVLSLAIVLGLAIALARMGKAKAPSKIAAVFIHYMRGIPLLIHLYVVYYALPPIVNKVLSLFGDRDTVYSVSPMIVLVISYGIYSSVGQAENIRGAFLSVDKGQYDAAYAVGMSESQALMRIVLPQAITVAIPMFLTAFLVIIRGMSVAFIIGAPDILAAAKLCSARNFGYLEAYIAAAAVYWVLCLGLGFFFDKVEVKLKKW